MYKKKIIEFDTVDSTNVEAKRIIRSGNRDDLYKTILIAKSQSKGKGRIEKSFYSPQGGLFITFILRPPEKITELERITKTMAVAVYEAIVKTDKTTKEQLCVKPINDIFYKNKKVCGILTESLDTNNDAKLDYIILGIGINNNMDKNKIPDDIKSIIDTLEVPYESLKENVIEKVFEFYNNISDENILTTYDTLIGNRWK